MKICLPERTENENWNVALNIRRSTTASFSEKSVDSKESEREKKNLYSLLHYTSNSDYVSLRHTPRGSATSFSFFLFGRQQNDTLVTSR
jgi:hypothetical protein